MLQYKLILHNPDLDPDHASIIVAGYSTNGNDLATIALSAAAMLLTSTEASQAQPDYAEDSDAKPE